MTKKEIIGIIDYMLNDPKLRPQILEQLYWIAYSDGNDKRAGQKFSSLVTKEVKKSLILQDR
jgi:hypothetical protein